VVRIVGEILLYHGFAQSAAAESTIAALTTWMGIAIQDIPLQGAFDPLHPFLDNQSKDWLWRGTFWSTATINAGASILSTFTNVEAGPQTGSHIDVRVKRKLREQEAIVLNVFATLDFLQGSSMAADVELNGNVRALIELH